MEIDCRKIGEYKIEELLGQTISCDCGKEHKIETKEIFMGEGVISKLKSKVENILPVGKVLVTTCEDILEKIANNVIEQVRGEEREIYVHAYNKKFTPTMEKAEELFSFPENIRLVISVGSGCVTDVTKYFAKKREIPFIAVATAPSMDGYISSTSVILVDGIKQSLSSKCPETLFCDYEIMATAPREMIAAGFGDVASKYMAIFDWYVAKEFTKEFYCQNIANMTIASAELATKAGRKIVQGKMEGYGDLIEALLKSSVAMQLLGLTRCASGGEHNTAHVLDMIERHKGLSERLHGEEVFLMYSRLVPIYKLFYENEVSDTALLPDMDERFEMLMSETGISAEVAEKLTMSTISPSAYNFLKKTLKEKRDTLADSIAFIYDKLPEQIDTFIKLYENDEGEWIREFDKGLIKSAISLSTEIKPKFVTLNIMKYLGLLEGYLSKNNR